MINLVGFSGAVGNETSNLADAIHEALPSSELYSFTTVVREQAVALGLNPRLTTLQDVGEELAANGFDLFVDLLLPSEVSCSTLLVDSIKHPGAWSELRRRFPNARHHLVYVDLDRRRRARRLARRGESINAERHPVESQVVLVRQEANRVVNGLFLGHNRRLICRDLLG